MEFTGPEPITVDHDVAEFDSGGPVLDNWLVSRALRNEREGGSRTYVVGVGGAVIGYCCLSADSVTHGAAPGRIRSRSCCWAAWRSRGPIWEKGIARALVRDAVLRTLQAAEIARIRALLVCALDEDAAEFYWYLGFVRSPIDSPIWMLPLATARSALGR